MHLDAIVVLDLLDGKLIQDQKDLWKEHLNSCADCKQFYREFQVFHSRLRRVHLQHATKHDMSRALQIFHNSGAESKVRRFIAGLVFDSSCPQLAAAVRGGGDQTRVLVLRAEDFEVTVKISGNREQREIFGQLLEPGPLEQKKGARLTLLQDGNPIGAAVADDVGEFHFADVPDGPLLLQIDIPAVGVIDASLPAN